jgi:heme-degrading monooxygenase HmoA
MYARVTFSTLQPGKFDEATKVVRDSILPAAKKQKGFKGLFLLGDRKTGKGMTIVLWNAEADMMAGESSGFYKEQVAKVAPLFAGAPTMEHYEVSVKG